MDKPSYLACLFVASNIPELVAEFDRLTGFDLSRKGAPINLMIDDATGHTDEAAKAFLKFVDECIYQPLQA